MCEFAGWFGRGSEERHGRECVWAGVLVGGIGRVSCSVWELARVVVRKAVGHFGPAADIYSSLAACHFINHCQSEYLQCGRSQQKRMLCKQHRPTRC